MAGIAYFLLPTGPAGVKFLTKRENQILVDRAMKARGEVANEGKVELVESLKVLLDYRCWMQACIIFCFNSSFGSLPAFLPTIVQDMGFTSIHAQALSAPPYLAAYFCCIALAFISDWLRHRGLLITLFACIGGTGYLLLRVFERTSVRYGAIYLITCGVFPSIALTFTLVTDNQLTSSKRGAGLVLFGIIGQCGSFLGAHIFPDEDKPYFKYGMGILTGVVFASGALACILSCALRWENHRKAGAGKLTARTKYVT